MAGRLEIVSAWLSLLAQEKRKGLGGGLATVTLQFSGDCAERHTLGLPDFDLFCVGSKFTASGAVLIAFP